MTTPQYDPNAPLATDAIATTSLDFLYNFQVLYDAFARNHVPLDDASLGGNHAKTELFPQNSDPQTSLNVVSIYSAFIEDQTNQVHYRLENNGEKLRVTNYQLYSLGTSATRYFTFLPGGIIVYFGLLDGPFNTKVTLSLDPPLATKIITVNAWPVFKTNDIANVGWGPSLTVEKNSATEKFDKIIFDTPAVGFAGPTSRVGYIILGNT